MLPVLKSPRLLTVNQRDHLASNSSNSRCAHRSALHEEIASLLLTEVSKFPMSQAVTNWAKEGEFLGYVDLPTLIDGYNLGVCTGEWREALIPHGLHFSIRKEFSKLRAALEVPLKGEDVLYLLQEKFQSPWKHCPLENVGKRISSALEDPSGEAQTKLLGVMTAHLKHSFNQQVLDSLEPGQARNLRQWIWSTVGLGHGEVNFCHVQFTYWHGSTNTGPLNEFLTALKPVQGFMEGVTRDTLVQEYWAAYKDDMIDAISAAHKEHYE